MVESKGELTWRDGLRIVDLQELAKQMYCRQCSSVLELCRTATETRHGLASVLGIDCANCRTTTQVYTSARDPHAADGGLLCYDINRKISVDMLLWQEANRSTFFNFLALLNIPVAALTPVDSTQISCSGESHASGQQKCKGQGQQKCQAQSATSLTETVNVNVPSTDCGRSANLGMGGTDKGATRNPEDITEKDHTHPSVVLSESTTKRKHSDTGSDQRMISELNDNDFQNEIDVSTTSAHSVPVPNNKVSGHPTGGPKTAVNSGKGLPAGQVQHSPESVDPARQPKIKQGKRKKGKRVGTSKNNISKASAKQDSENPEEIHRDSTATKTRKGRVSVKDKTSSLARKNDSPPPQRQTRQSLGTLQTKKVKRLGNATHPVKEHVQKLVHEQLSASSVAVKAVDKCPMCKKNLGSSRGLKVHLRRVHPQVEVQSGKGAEQKVAKEMIVATKTAEMDATECKQSAMSDDASAGDTDEMDADSSMDSAEQQILSAKEDASLKVTSKPVQQEVGEERKHSQTYRFECKECERRFSFSAEYTTHMRESHGVEKPHKCRKCSEAYATENQLKVHRKSHLPEEPDGTHECSICLKIFPNGRRLRAHRTTHTREERLQPLKRYHCTFCGEEFQKNYFLQIHLRYHTGEKPYRCSNCDAAFVTKPQRTAHFKKCTAKRKAFLCELCGGRFGSACTLRKHERVHTGEKPHKCRFCEQSFGRRNTLKIHERQHTGERPYVCDKCAAAFKQRVSLVTHMRNKHSINATLYSQPREGPRYTHAHLISDKPPTSSKKNKMSSKSTPVSLDGNFSMNTHPAGGTQATMLDMAACDPVTFPSHQVITQTSMSQIPVSMDESSNIITLAHAASVLMPVSTVGHLVSQTVATVNHMPLMKDDEGPDSISRAADSMISFAPIARFVDLTQNVPPGVIPSDDGRVLSVMQEDGAIPGLQPQDSSAVTICPSTLSTEYETVYYN